MSTNGVEIICNIKQRLFKQEKKLLEYRPDHFGKKIIQLRIGNK